MDLFNYQQLFAQTMTISKVRFIIKQILEACSYLHSCHVMHRDLKPDNILICCNSAVIKVADFGYARTFTHVITTTACQFKYSFPIQVNQNFYFTLSRYISFSPQILISLCLPSLSISVSLSLSLSLSLSDRKSVV